jgi:hypothetical protein
MMTDTQRRESRLVESSWASIDSSTKVAFVR